VASCWLLVQATSHQPPATIYEGDLIETITLAVIGDGRSRQHRIGRIGAAAGVGAAK